MPPAPTPPDPFATAEAQTGYNINSAIAQNLLNNVNQVTPYGNINFAQTGDQMVGAEPAVADTPATGGYWNGQAWVSTGSTKGRPTTPGISSLAIRPRQPLAQSCRTLSTRQRPML